MRTSSPLEPEKVKQAFASIAYRYVLANHLLSLGIDCLWRRRVVRLIQGWSPHDILDIATGTGDLALALQGGLPQARIIGADFCQPMLDVAAQRGFRAEQLVCADALNLPFADESFDVVTVAFGLRNMADYPRALAEMKRVLRPGGHLLILDFSLPRGVLRKPYRFYLHHILPRLAGWITRNPAAYQYLGDSIESFPQRQEMCSLLSQQGLINPTCTPLTGGIASIYTANS